MGQMKVMVLVHRDCVPPEGATMKLADWAHWKTEFYVKKALLKLGHKISILPVSDDLGFLQKAVLDFQPNIVFNLLEEFQNEPEFESHVAAFLELMGVPYTGCNPQGLSLGRDKALSKKILSYHGIPTPKFFTVEQGKKVKKPDYLDYPLIVKSLNEEASLGISQSSIVDTESALKKRVKFIHESIFTPALVEEYIPGREIYVGVLGSKNPTVLHPWELEFGDLNSDGHPIATRKVKFSKNYSLKKGIKRGAARNLSPMVLQKIQNLSRDIFKALKLSGYARLDFRITDSGEVIFLEANPNAELANKECLANAAHHSGISYEELISRILRLGLAYRQAA